MNILKFFIQNCRPNVGFFSPPTEHFKIGKFIIRCSDWNHIKQIGRAHV